MKDIINQRIDAAESIASRLKKMVLDTAYNIEDSIMKEIIACVKVSVNKRIESGGKSRNSVRTLRYVSLAALIIGGMGWIGTVAQWSKLLSAGATVALLTKILTIGGGAGLVYSLCKKDTSTIRPQSEPKTVQPVEAKLPTSFVVNEATVMIDELKKATDLWSNFTVSSKSILDNNLKSQTWDLSAQDLFNIESPIRVPKTLSFPLIEYRNILEDASTPHKLKKAVNEVVKLASAEIDKVALSQISAYRKMDEEIDSALS